MNSPKNSQPTPASSEERRNRLQRYVTWTEAEFREFDAVLRVIRQVDAALWRTSP